MGSVGKAAFSTILVLGAITGVLVYYLFTEATPVAGKVISPFRENITASSGSSSGSGSTAKVPIDESKYATKVAIQILKGAAVQGNPNFDPNPAQASSDALITWTNNDEVPHTATSGTGSSDTSPGKLFDSGIISPGDKFSVPASQLGPGEHDYYCQVHPYMKGKITIQ
jgi:plastocyanin